MHESLMYGIKGPYWSGTQNKNGYTWSSCFSSSPWWTIFTNRKGKEELNLDLNFNNLKYLGIIEEFFEKSSFENIKVHCINVVYSYILEDNIEINLDQQHENYNWFDVKDQKLHFYVRQKINLLNPLTS